MWLLATLPLGGYINKPNHEGQVQAVTAACMKMLMTVTLRELAFTTATDHKGCLWAEEHDS